MIRTYINISTWFFLNQPYLNSIATDFNKYVEYKIGLVFPFQQFPNGILNFGSLCIKVLSNPHIHVRFTKISNPTRNACWIIRTGALLFALFSVFPSVCFAGQLTSIWHGLIISLEFLLPQAWYPSHCPSCGRGLPPTGWLRASWAAALLVSKCF